MNPEESIRTALSVLFPEGSVVELRALGERTHYGYYTDFNRLAGMQQFWTLHQAYLAFTSP